MILIRPSVLNTAGLQMVTSEASLSRLLLYYFRLNLLALRIEPLCPDVFNWHADKWSFSFTTRNAKHGPNNRQLSRWHVSLLLAKNNEEKKVDLKGGKSVRQMMINDHCIPFFRVALDVNRIARFRRPWRRIGCWNRLISIAYFTFDWKWCVSTIYLSLIITISVRHYGTSLLYIFSFLQGNRNSLFLMNAEWSSRLRRWQHELSEWVEEWGSGEERDLKKQYFLLYARLLIMHVTGTRRSRSRILREIWRLFSVRSLQQALNRWQR